MCFPAVFAALGASATTAATLSTVAGVAGTAFSAIGAMQQAQAAQDQANYNAVVAENNAKLAEYKAQDAQQRGELEAQKVQREAAQLRGAQRATMAARGLSLSEGTPLSLLEQTDYFSATDVATTRTNAGKEAWANRVQKANFETEAMSNRAAASSINPLMAGATSLISSASKVADKWYTPSAGAAVNSGSSWSVSNGGGYGRFY